MSLDGETGLTHTTCVIPADRRCPPVGTVGEAGEAMDQRPNGHVGAPTSAVERHVTPAGFRIRVSARRMGEFSPATPRHPETTVRAVTTQTSTWHGERPSPRRSVPSPAPWGWGLRAAHRDRQRGMGTVAGGRHRVAPRRGSRRSSSRPACRPASAPRVRATFREGRAAAALSHRRSSV